MDVEAILNEAFAGVITERPRLQALVGPISGAINGQIENQVRQFVASDAFADLWVTANTRAQQAFVRLLEGDSTGAVSLEGEQVVLDVSEVIDQVKQRLVDRGLTFVEKAPIPTIDKQIVLLEAPALKQARTIYAFANPVAKWLIVVVALLYLGAFVLSRRRARMTVTIGLGILANGLLVAWALSVGRQLFINELSGTVFGPASSVFYDTLLTYLERGWQVFAWLGVSLVAAGWFAGTNSSGTAVRTSLVGGSGIRWRRTARRPIRIGGGMGGRQRALAQDRRRRAGGCGPALGEHGVTGATVLVVGLGDRVACRHPVPGRRRTYAEIPGRVLAGKWRSRRH